VALFLFPPVVRDVVENGNLDLKMRSPKKPKKLEETKPLVRAPRM
jgi:hypothetical protein